MLLKTEPCLEKALKILEEPVLIISSQVGGGNVSIGEALKERLKDYKVSHVLIEDIEPSALIREDILRYKFISDNFPFVLNLIYRIPIFYYRKLARERIFKNKNLKRLRETIDSLKIKTVVSISHRPTFWLSVLKKNEKLSFKLYGLLTEFGKNLGWKYIFWEVIDGFFSPLSRKELSLIIPDNVRYFTIEPFCRLSFYNSSYIKGDINKVLIMAGYWGQIFFYKIRNILNQILKELPQMQIVVVCGTNEKLFRKLRFYFESNQRVAVYGQLKSILEPMLECASIITKPGFSTIIEAFITKKAIFLLKGMPVAEDNNAKYAIANFDAQWFSIKNFIIWHNSM
ncbi:MAG: hypothetical protein KBB01_02530 [Candidatus Omnitrophica bacterium]|jgi:UDP-N-acetylglucosamine:LPS N-acetylglucosamine transferase|nr:hypothetical protein [Candidatus Omnitrophota bacterium]